LSSSIALLTPNIFFGGKGLEKKKKKKKKIRIIIFLFYGDALCVKTKMRTKQNEMKGHVYLYEGGI
jgi:hypothetical protein